MIDKRLVQDEITRLENNKMTYERYRHICLMNNDHHGVQDASSDLREIEAKIEVLKWVLG